MLLLGHWPALVGADARLFELRPVAGIDGSSLMGHRVGSCAFSPITLVDSAIPIISVLEAAEEAFASRVVRAAALLRHGSGQAVSLAYADPAGPSVMAPPVRVADRVLARGERPARVLQGAVGERRVRAPSDPPCHDEVLASMYFSPFSPTYFHQSRQRGCAGFANADAPLSAPRRPPPSRPRRQSTRPSGGTTDLLS